MTALVIHICFGLTIYPVTAAHWRLFLWAIRANLAVRALPYYAMHILGWLIIPAYVIVGWLMLAHLTRHDHVSQKPCDTKSGDQP